MKQIFDWLREHLEETAQDVSPNNDKLVVLAIVERLINEAEAKWEADCCEWKRNENTKALILSPHNPHSAMWAVDVKMYPYCNCCGKPIKVLEVE